jgi:RNA polymerase sigma factor (sigma-70 family)
VDYQQLFLDNLGLIDQVVRFVARRHHLSAVEQDDFRGLVHLKLVEHDYAILRKFEGRSSLATFLTTVISRIFLDDRIARWGKWRPSAAARRLGPIAMALEQLMSRDGMSFDSAVETLRVNHHIKESDARLADMRLRLAVRPPRREAGEDELVDVATTDRPADDAVGRAERTELAARIGRALGQALRALEPQDVLILKLRFLDEFPVSQIARTLGLDQKPLYRRIDQLLHRLCAALLAEGLSREDVLALLGGADVDLGPVF